MKKIIVLLAIATLFTLTGCKSQDIKDAKIAFEEEKYHDVVELIAEYEIEEEEVRNILSISNGCIAFENKNYEQAIENLEGKQLSSSQKEVLNNAYYEKYKMELDAAEDMSVVINDYYKKVETTTKLDEYTVDKFNELYSSNVYADFVNADEIINNLENDCAIKTKLEEIKANSKFKRAEAFLVGTWIRKDGTTFDGIVIRVMVNNGDISALVDDVSLATNKIYVETNDLKWQTGSFVDDMTFTFNDLAKGPDSSYYIAATGTLNYDEYQINVHTIDTDDDYKTGSNQVWIKEEYVNSFSDVEELSEKDYIVQASCDDELKEKYDNNLLEQLKTEYGNGAYSYWSYDAEEDESKEAVITTHRGIQIGSTKQTVMKSYGIGETNFFDKNTDELFNVLEDDWKSVMEAECDEFIKYVKKDLGCIKFYFNKQDEVVLIFFCVE